MEPCGEQKKWSDALMSVLVNLLYTQHEISNEATTPRWIVCYLEDSKVKFWCMKHLSCLIAGSIRILGNDDL